jgi:hypothetical protein
MTVLICAGDISQVVEIRDTIERVLEEDKMTVFYDKRIGTYAVQTENGSKDEILIYLLPDWKAADHMQRLQVLRERFLKKLSLAESQIICAIIFPATEVH